MGNLGRLVRYLKKYSIQTEKILISQACNSLEEELSKMAFEHEIGKVLLRKIDDVFDKIISKGSKVDSESERESSDSFTTNSNVEEDSDLERLK